MNTHTSFWVRKRNITRMKIRWERVKEAKVMAEKKTGKLEKKRDVISGKMKRRSKENAEKMKNSIK